MYDKGFHQKILVRQSEEKVQLHTSTGHDAVETLFLEGYKA
jgi:hypothetical protein